MVVADSLQHLVKTFEVSTSKILNSQTSRIKVVMNPNKKIIVEQMRKGTLMQWILQVIRGLNWVIKVNLIFWIMLGHLYRKKWQLLNIKSSQDRLIKNLITASLSLHLQQRLDIRPRIQIKQTKIVSWSSLIWVSTEGLIFLLWRMDMV